MIENNYTLDTSQFTGAINAIEVESEDRLKILLIGKPKSGKSCTAVTMPFMNEKYPLQHGIWVCDFDDRKESIVQFLHNKPWRDKVYIKTYIDTDSENPTAFQQFDVDIGMWEYKVEQQRKGEQIITPCSYVVDSATFFGRAAMNYFFKMNSAGANTYAGFTMGTKKVRIPRGFDSWKIEVDILQQCIQRLSRLGHVLFVGHEGPEKDKAATTKDNPVYKDNITLWPTRSQEAVSNFNEVWRQVYENGQFKLICKQTENFLGATTLLIEGEEPPNIQNLLRKHIEAKLKK